MGVFPAWSLRVAAGEGMLRGAGDARPRCEGVVTWAAFFEAEPDCCGVWVEGVGVDIVKDSF